MRSGMDLSILAQKCGSCRFQDGNLLNGTCPQPTIGYSAFIFFSLIEYIIKSQCDISDPCRRVKELNNSTDVNAFDNMVFDYVIVGGGTGGNTLFHLTNFSYTGAIYSTLQMVNYHIRGN